MRDPNLDFPPSPYREQIQARLCVNPYPDDLEAWTCDQAAQVLSGIDPYGFNQDHADYFLKLSEILKSCLIAGEIDTCEHDGEKYLKPFAALEWEITRASYEGYKPPGSVTYLYEEKLNKLNQIKTFTETGTMLNRYQEPVEAVINNRRTQTEPSLIDEDKRLQQRIGINGERDKDATKWINETKPKPDLEGMTIPEIRTALQARDAKRDNKLWSKGFDDWNRKQQVWPKKNAGKKSGK